MSNTPAIIKKAKKILLLHRNVLERKYGASGSSVGYKIKNGKITDDVALIFYVKNKKSDKQLKDEGISPVPTKINGIPTDVVVFKKGLEPR
jgi:hypothetical protein